MSLVLTLAAFLLVAAAFVAAAIGVSRRFAVTPGVAPQDRDR
jgi:hypothetical protein